MSENPTNAEVSGSVTRAAMALCQLRCALRDRDPVCQEMGRCGDNWRGWIGAALRAEERK